MIRTQASTADSHGHNHSCSSTRHVSTFNEEFFINCLFSIYLFFHADCWTLYGTGRSADARLLFFVRANDLWALDLDDGASERRLTFASAGTGDDRRMAGVADYIMQEEFDRYTGYWPAPAVEVGADGTRVYRVAYLQVDQVRL